MNSTMRMHLSSLLNKEIVGTDRDNKDRDNKDRHDRPRMFGREITNEYLPVRNKSQTRLQAKSFFGGKDATKETNIPVTPTLIYRENSPVQHLSVWCQQLSPYADDIFRYMISQQRLVQTAYLPADLKMRAVLVDWLIDVHFRFKLLPETLFKATGILDQYLTTLPQLPPKKLQLIGIACLFIAAKYEQIYPPATKHFLDVLCKTYNLQDLIDVEGRILKTLQFQLTLPTVCNFLQRLIKIYKLSGNEMHLPMYLLELTLLDPQFLKYSPSTLAQASVFLTKVIYKKSAIESTIQCKQCAKQLLLILQNAPKSAYQASRNKFSTKQYSEVSTILIKSKDSEGN